MNLDSEGHGENIPSTPVAAYYGLHIPPSGINASDHRMICAFLRRILPGVSECQSHLYWRFVVDCEGFVRDVPWTNSDPDDVPFRYPFEETYDHLWRGFTLLHLTTPPPERVEWNHEEWTAAAILLHRRKQIRETWLEWFQRHFLFMRSSNSRHPANLPPNYATHCHQQMAKLQSWILDRIADKTLLNAIHNDVADK